MSLTDIQLSLTEKLRDPEYRHEFFKIITQDDIAAQIRGLREKRGMRQVDFAREADMKQSAVSRIEQAEYSKWSFSTLMRAAKALDARLRVIFEPAEEAIKEYEEAEIGSSTDAMAADAKQQAIYIDTAALLQIEGNNDESSRSAHGALWQILQSVTSQRRPAVSDAPVRDPAALSLSENAKLGAGPFGENRSLRAWDVQ